MAARVIFKPAAVADVEEARGWYEKRKVGLGVDFLQSVRRVHLFNWGIRKPIRWCSAGAHGACEKVSLPYFYTPEANQITMFSVFHAAKDPQIWKRRV